MHMVAASLKLHGQNNLFVVGHRVDTKMERNGGLSVGRPMRQLAQLNRAALGFEAVKQWVQRHANRLRGGAILHRGDHPTRPGPIPPSGCGSHSRTGTRSK